ncbi:MAG: HNH endonuclease [Acidimicrobiales bacterium]|nr:HNH endonuclease [Acidimicrobiales bacterium]
MRDKGCVGCGMSPERCQHHHIDHWQYGGPTDYENLLTICPNCHNDKIHQHGFIARWHPGHTTRHGQPANPGYYELQPPGTPADNTSGQHTDGRTGPRAPPL